MIVILTTGFVKETIAQPQTSAASEYAAIKPIVAKLLEHTDDFYLQDVLPRETSVNLFACGALEGKLGLRGNDLSTALARVAAYDYSWHKLLPAAGYPDEITTPLINDAEHRLFTQVLRSGGNRGFLTALGREANHIAQQLNAIRVRRGLRAKPLHYNDECGGPGVLVTFSVPRDAQLFLASEFYVELCKIRLRPPFDRDKCNHWEEVFDGAVESLSGLYNYIAEWADGTRRVSRFNADKLGSTNDAVFKLKK
jgi:hypothetical protein